MRKSRGFEGEVLIEIPQVALSKCLKLSLISSLFITRMGFYPKAHHHYFQRPIGISQEILIYCTDGKGWIQSLKKREIIQAGEFIVIPSKIPHSYGADNEDPWSIYWVHLTGTMLNVAEDLFLWRNGVQKVKQITYSEERNKLFKKIADTFLKGYSASNLIFANLTLNYYLASFLVPEHFEKKSTEEVAVSVIDKAIEYMQQNLSNAVTLDNIAQSAHLSISFFSRKFKKETGYTPIEYFNHLRIQKSCQLLQFSELRINEVALEVGIPDPFYFSRLFKQQMGVSPVNYRKNGRV